MVIKSRNPHTFSDAFNSLLYDGWKVIELPKLKKLYPDSIAQKEFKMFVNL